MFFIKQSKHSIKRLDFITPVYLSNGTPSKRKMRVLVLVVKYVDNRWAVCVSVDTLTFCLSLFVGRFKITNHVTIIIENYISIYYIIFVIKSSFMNTNIMLKKDNSSVMILCQCKVPSVTVFRRTNKHILIRF